MALVCEVSPAARHSQIVPIQYEGTRSGRETVTVTTEANVASAVVIGRKRRKASWKRSKHMPCAVLVIIGLGICLLITILVCIIYETIRSGAGIRRGRNQGSLYQSDDDIKYHVQIVDYVNSLPNSTWKARYNRFASRSKQSQQMDMGEMAKIADHNQHMSEEHLFADTEAHLRVRNSCFSMYLLSNSMY
ncbi:unnamed protein product [Toxocara canis]|uniref:Conserved plasma membrane protein n=1 Tax=Toxocara canis TaxID=6265 RepID=A0A183U110_TOXCA|nr:unnamed protein product [Toxocara canis]